MLRKEHGRVTSLLGNYAQPTKRTVHERQIIILLKISMGQRDGHTFNNMYVPLRSPLVLKLASLLRLTLLGQSSSITDPFPHSLIYPLSPDTPAARLFKGSQAFLIKTKISYFRASAQRHCSCSRQILRCSTCSG